MRKIKNLLVILITMTLILNGCSSEKSYEKYSHRFLGTFDTVIDVIVYEENENKAQEYFEYIENRFTELHGLYTGYEEYDHVNNVYTINENAGISPIKVDKDLYDLIDISINNYYNYSDQVDISIGSIINVWQNYQDLNNEIFSSNSQDQYTIEERLPSEEELLKAKENIGIDHIVLDEKNQSIYIDDPNVVLDVGATAKGYAVELVAREVEEMGCQSAIISAGGNVRTIGKPLDGQREKWGVGIWDPSADENNDGQNNIIETVYVGQTSVITSGDYQRYFIVDGERYHHIIDKETMKPANYFRSVTIVHQDSGLADFLSTAVFVLPFQEGKALVESIDGAQCMWVFNDLSMDYTDGFKEIAKSYGASND